MGPSTIEPCMAALASAIVSGVPPRIEVVCVVIAGRLGGNRGTLAMADLLGIPPTAEVSVTVDVPVDGVEGGGGVGGGPETLLLAGVTVGKGVKWDNLVSKLSMKLSSTVFSDADSA